MIGSRAGLLPTVSLAVLGSVALAAAPAQALTECSELPNHTDVENALKAAVEKDNGGLDTEMWATVVNRDGEVCLVAFSGGDRGDQWPGSRVISAQKANTANAFSLPDLALSTANLWAATQPGGSLFGLQFSNPVDTSVAYGNNPNKSGDGKAEDYGMPDDPMVGSMIGGVNVFGGGLALYDELKGLVGAVGVSGNTSCADHNIAWRVRDALDMDFLPPPPDGGVGDPGDNIIFDIADDDHGNPESADGFGHPECGDGSEAANDGVIANCPLNNGASNSCT